MASLKTVFKQDGKRKRKQPYDTLKGDHSRKQCVNPKVMSCLIWSKSRRRSPWAARTERRNQLRADGLPHGSSCEFSRRVYQPGLDNVQCPAMVINRIAKMARSIAKSYLLSR